jgi:hypothetical protein
MGRRAWVIVPFIAIGAVLVAIAALMVAPSVANATPGFARQTGLSCEACHTVFPELTPFGRKFKLNAYVFTNVSSWNPSTSRGRER